MKKVTEEWLRFAKDDLDVALKISNDRNLTNMVAFHAHQAIEKCIKAVAEEYEIKVKKIHNLITLEADILNVLSIEIDGNILNKLNEIYISSSYPGDLGLMPYGKPSLKDAAMFLEFAQDTYQKITAFLSGEQQK